MAFWSWEYGTLAPCPIPRGRTGPDWKENTLHIWKASGAPDVPGPPGRGCGRGRGAKELCLPAAPRRGLGVCRAWRLPQLVFIPRSGLGCC